MGRQDQGNRGNQMNPNNHAYWQARGHNGRPDDWQERTEEEKARDRGERQK